MSLLRFLGLGSPSADQRAPASLAEAVRRRLESLSPQRAEFVAAFAGLLVRVAHVDVEVCAAEERTLRRLIEEHAGLSAAEAQTVADLVTSRATGMDGIEYAELTRAFNEFATVAEKEHLIDCLYAVAVASGNVSLAEDEEIRSVARALLLSHRQLVDIRSRYKEYREVIQGLQRPR